MPNWCSTTIYFHGEKEEITELHNKIKEHTSKTFVPTDFGQTWLGNILYGVGLEDRIDAAENRIRCRGSITYFDEIVDSDGECSFRIDTETAWAPMICMWEETIKKLGYKSIGFSFQSEECGMGEYFMYDPYGDFDEKCGKLIYEKIEPGDWD